MEKTSMDLAFVNAFIRSTENVLTTMAKITSLKKKEASVEKNFKPKGDVIGTMGLSGHADGSMAVSFTRKLAARLVANLLDSDPNDLSPDDIDDGVGELVNMIAGGAKTELAGTKYHFNLSIPTVVSGEGARVGMQRGVHYVVLVFNADGDEFAIQVSLSPAE